MNSRAVLTIELTPNQLEALHSDDPSIEAALVIKSVPTDAKDVVGPTILWRFATAADLAGAEQAVKDNRATF